MWTWFHKLGSPPHFFRISGALLPWISSIAFLLMVLGIYGGLVLSPADYQQGDGFRIIYVHVPAAWLSMLAYVTMASAAGVGLVWRIKLAHAVAASCAVPGASFTFLALATGSIWGKPMWGTWWEWDARLTSELILLFLYLGYISLRNAFSDVSKADRASAVLALVGVVNIPIIHYSVTWWNTLHQGATVSKMAAPSISGSMLWPLLVSAIGFTLFFVALLFTRTRAEILMRERRTKWLTEVLEGT